MLGGATEPLPGEAMKELTLQIAAKPDGKAAMLKAIHAAEDVQAAREKAFRVGAKLREQRLMRVIPCGQVRLPC